MSEMIDQTFCVVCTADGIYYVEEEDYNKVYAAILNEAPVVALINAFGGNTLILRTSTIEAFYIATPEARERKMRYDAELEAKYDSMRKEFTGGWE